MWEAWACPLTSWSAAGAQGGGAQRWRRRVRATDLGRAAGSLTCCLLESIGGGRAGGGREGGASNEAALQGPSVCLRLGLERSGHVWLAVRGLGAAGIGER